MITQCEFNGTVLGVCMKSGGMVARAGTAHAVSSTAVLLQKFLGHWLPTVRVHAKHWRFGRQLLVVTLHPETISLQQLISVCPPSGTCHVQSCNILCRELGLKCVHTYVCSLPAIAWHCIYQRIYMLHWLSGFHRSCCHHWQVAEHTGHA